MKTIYHVALNKNREIIAVHKDIGDNPLVPPQDGFLIDVSEQDYKIIWTSMMRGVFLKYTDDFTSLEQAPKFVATRSESTKKEITLEHVKEARRRKMREISDTSVGSRGRNFEAFPHVPMMDQHRHIDTLFMYVTGRLKDTDTILTRNLRTGEYEQITLEEWAKQMEESFLLRQKLRERDQEFRNQINAIVKDKNKTDEEKLSLIDGLNIPEHLAVDNKSTHQKMIIK